MKKILLGMTGMMIGMSACTNNENVAREKIEHYFDSVANDPGSYKFINIEQDTITRTDTLSNDSFMYKHYQERVNHDQEEVNYYSKQIKGSYGYIYQSGYEMYVKSLNEYKTDLNKEILKLNSQKRLHDSILNTDKDSIVKINYTLNFRAKNAMGALMKHKGYISYYINDNRWSKVDFD